MSVVTLWETALLHDRGAIRLPAGFSAWCDRLDAIAGFRIEPLTRGDVEEARSLTTLVDPHDRLIGGTALRLQAALISADRRMQGEKRLRTLW